MQKYMGLRGDEVISEIRNMQVGLEEVRQRNAELFNDKEFVIESSKQLETSMAILAENNGTAFDVVNTFKQKVKKELEMI